MGGLTSRQPLEHNRLQGTVAMYIRRINQLGLEGLPETVEVGDIIATVFELVIGQEHSAEIRAAEFLGNFKTEMAPNDGSEIIGVT